MKNVRKFIRLGLTIWEIKEAYIVKGVDIVKEMEVLKIRTRVLITTTHPPLWQFFL